VKSEKQDSRKLCKDATVSKYVCEEMRKDKDKINIMAWDSFIPDRVSIKRAIPGQYFPDEFEPYFRELWENIKTNFGE